MSTKRKAPGKLAPPTVRASAKLPTKSLIDESKTSVADTDINPSQADTIEISSDEPSDEDDVSDEDEDMEEPQQTNGAIKVNGATKTATQLPSPARDAEEEDEEEEQEATFGELLRGNDAIDVPALLKQDSNAVSQPTRSLITPPQYASLTTVLTQALRTDDTDLLESCLHTKELHFIRNTIETIDSTLAGTLLNKLASRLHRRPGRAGSLMTWVQWTLIAHGGAIASQPKVIQSLSSLQKVLSERAKGLGSLLALKGKLDLLEGQMDMRRNMQRASKLAHPNSDSEDDEDVIWVEGENNGSPNSLSNTRRKRGVEDSDDDEPVMNGVLGDSSDEEDDDVDADDDSEDGEESLDEDEVDHDDVDESMGEEEDSDVEAAPPSKMQKVGKSFAKRK